MIARSILVLLLLVAPALADRATALKYYRAGEKAYAAQSFGDAAVAFDKAFSELALPEIAFSAAQAYRRQYRVEPLPHYVERAVTLYAFYLSKVKKGGRVGDAADSLGEMKVEAERLAREGKTASTPAPSAPRTQLGVTATLVGIDTETKVREIVDVAGDPAITVRTFLDGKPVPPGKMIDVDPGEHVVRAEADGFEPVERKKVALANDQDLVELPLEPLPAKITITTERGARIIVDDRAIGDAPLAAFELPAGRHVVRITRAGRVPVARELVVARGETRSLAVDLEPTLQRSSVKFVLVAGGLAALTAITTTAFAVHYDREGARLVEQLELGSRSPDVLADYRSVRRDRDSAVTGAWVAGAVTLGIVGIAGALYVFDRPSSEGIQVTPVVGATGAGATVIGRF